GKGATDADCVGIARGRGGRQGTGSATGDSERSAPWPMTRTQKPVRIHYWIGAGIMLIVSELQFWSPSRDRDRCHNRKPVLFSSAEARRSADVSAVAGIANSSPFAHRRAKPGFDFVGS